MEMRGLIWTWLMPVGFKGKWLVLGLCSHSRNSALDFRWMERKLNEAVKRLHNVEPTEHQHNQEKDRGDANYYQQGQST